MSTFSRDHYKHAVWNRLLCVYIQIYVKKNFQILIILFEINVNL